MIVKRLRTNKNWSQEQLAQMSGLSLRTIQRIEGGHKPGTESLRCLAAVFEMDVAALEQPFMAIDKTSKQWRQKPLWLRVLFWGSNVLWLKSRKEALLFEGFIITIALVFLSAALIQPASERAILLGFSSLCFGSAWLWSVLIRLSDHHQIWQTGH